MVELKYTPEEAARKAEELIAQRAEEKRERKKAVQRDERTLARHRKWYAANKEKLRKQHIEKKFGITGDQWEALFKSQNQRCAGCGADRPGRSYGWHTDHCHSSGVVRGVLCHGCNTSLGLLGEDADRIERLAQYAREKCNGRERREARSIEPQDTGPNHQTGEGLQPPAREHQKTLAAE